MYHEFADGDYLPAGAELWAVTADPDEAARAPVGHILIGDPADAIKRLADTIPGAGRPPLPAGEPLPQADTTGPAFTMEAILDAVNAAKSDSTVFAHEWTSTMASAWDRLEITRPRSLFLSAAGGLGWGLPGAIGLQLGDPSRRVVARCSATARCITRSAGSGPPPSTTSPWSSSSRATANTGR
jgi:benzoylformate decarboxylase